ncbi:MAG: protease modulator HflC [Chloroflexi bacterium]|nr:protease modulator HflC [Chloroflexota bacterium]
MLGFLFSPLSRLIILAVVVVVVSQSFYIVNQQDQVILLEFGRPVSTMTTPGLYPKTPFVQNIERFDRRILVSDAHPQEYLTSDKNRLVVDHVSRWRISDPLQFFQTVRNEAGALARLDDIIISELRQELGQEKFTDIISARRDFIMEAVSKRVAATAAQQTNGGIEVIDVRIKRADLPQEVQASVFARIIAERSRIASQYRAEGAEQAFRIRADADKERTIIEARAYEESQRARGEGDGKSTEIYASAYNRDAEFYAFTRNLEAYEKYLRQRSTLVMSGDGELFRYLNGSSQPR